MGINSLSFNVDHSQRSQKRLLLPYTVYTFALQVAGELEGQHTNPIAADAFVLDTMLEKAFDCAQEVKSKQMTLTAEQEKRDAETETAFFAGILFQRDQVQHRTTYRVIVRNTITTVAQSGLFNSLFRKRCATLTSVYQRNGSRIPYFFIFRPTSAWLSYNSARSLSFVSTKMVLIVVLV